MQDRKPFDAKEMFDTLIEGIRDVTCNYHDITRRQYRFFANPERDAQIAFLTLITTSCVARYQKDISIANCYRLMMIIASALLFVSEKIDRKNLLFSTKKVEVYGMKLWGSDLNTLIIGELEKIFRLFGIQSIDMVKKCRRAFQRQLVIHLENINNKECFKPFFSLYQEILLEYYNGIIPPTKSESFLEESFAYTVKCGIETASSGLSVAIVPTVAALLANSVTGPVAFLVAAIIIPHVVVYLRGKAIDTVSNNIVEITKTPFMYLYHFLQDPTNHPDVKKQILQSLDHYLDVSGNDISETEKAQVKELLGVNSMPMFSPKRP